MIDISKGDIMIYLKVKCIQVYNKIFFIQKNYAKQIFKTYDIAQYKLAAICVDKHYKLVVDLDKEACKPTIYWGLIRSLLHLTITCLDIKYSIGLCRKFMQKPQQLHLLASKRILKYIKGTKDFGVFFSNQKNSTLQGYIDFK